MSYNSKYTGEQVESLLEKAGTAIQEHQDISGKQDVISDLAAIRDGASKGATALQSVPSEYVTETELTNKGYATTSSVNTALGGKVDKVTGKQLSTEDFTTLLKQKLEGLSNYDDKEIQEAVSKLRTDLDTLVSGDTTTAIKTFNEIIAFLDGISDTEDLVGIIASIEQQIAKKMDKITLATVATSGSYNDLTDKPTIPSAVTESTVSGWGFTKNTGTYSKPSGGIPKTDLESSVQSSLNKAETALQTEQYTGTYSKPSGGIPKSDLASAVQTSLGKADTALQSYTETDPTVPSWAKAASKPTYTASEVGALPSTTVIPTKVSQLTNDSNFTSNTGTITGITMNGASKGTSGVVNLGTVITAHQDISGKQDKLVSGTNIKTVDGTSLLGSGNISISTPTIDTFQTRTGTTHGISSFAANTVFSCTASNNTTSITISGFANPTPATRAAYYTIVFKTTSCTFTVPSTVMWVGGNAIEFDSSTAYTYEVNFMKIQLSEGERYLATWNRY